MTHATATAWIKATLINPETGTPFIQINLAANQA
jgi:hypothetical protein